MKPIDKLMDCQHVKRWTLVGTTETSTVASHSFNVACIALAIHKEMFNTLHIDRNALCFHAMMHDVDEAETGDMPTPTKEAIRAKGVDPNRLFDTQGQIPEPRPEVKEIIKLADMIDNYIFIYEHGVGARARSAVVEVAARLSRAIAGASPDAGRAAGVVLDYVLHRKSETDEERRRLAAISERLRQTAELGRSPAAHILGREPLDKCGVP